MSTEVATPETAATINDELNGNVSPPVYIEPTEGQIKAAQEMALIDLYVTVVKNLPCRPLRDFTPKEVLDWVATLPLRSPSQEVREIIHFVSQPCLGDARTLLLGLYYLLALPIGQVANNRVSSGSPEALGFRQSLPADTDNGSVTALHYLAADLAERAVKGTMSFVHVGAITTAEKKTRNLRIDYAWSLLGTNGRPTFASWTEFLASLANNVGHLLLDPAAMQLATSKLETFIAATLSDEQRVTEKLQSLQIGPPRSRSGDFTDTFVNEVTDREWKNTVYDSWAVVPPSDTVTQTLDEEMGWEPMLLLQSTEGNHGHLAPLDAPGPLGGDDDDLQSGYVVGQAPSNTLGNLDAAGPSQPWLGPSNPLDLSDTEREEEPVQTGVVSFFWGALKFGYAALSNWPLG